MTSIEFPDYRGDETGEVFVNNRGPARSISNHRRLVYPLSFLFFAFVGLSSIFYIGFPLITSYPQKLLSKECTQICVQLLLFLLMYLLDRGVNC